MVGEWSSFTAGGAVEFRKSLALKTCPPSTIARYAFAPPCSDRVHSNLAPPLSDRTYMCVKTYDTCHEKIDLFGVQNRVILELPWWKYCQAYQPVKFLIGWLPNFWLFWYQIQCTKSYRTNFTQVWRPKNCQLFEPQIGLFSRDTHHTTIQKSCKRCYENSKSLGNILTLWQEKSAAPAAAKILGMVLIRLQMPMALRYLSMGNLTLSNRDLIQA